MRRFGLTASIVAAATLAVACSPSADPASTTAPSTVALPTRSDDGTLVLGLLLPASGPGAEIGMSMREGAQLAIDEINRAGGVNGRTILTEEADEGDTPVIAARSVAELLDHDVDAIIGPASSVIAATTLPVTGDAGVLTCSPSASALQLQDFPDDALFARTIPSDALQAEAMANLMEGTGYRRASIVYLDDSYGRAFADAVIGELEVQNIEVVQSIAFDPSDDDYTNEAARAATASVVAIVGDNEAGTRMVDALFAVGDDQLEIVVNDAMRVPSSPRTYRALSDNDRTHLRGVSPQSHIGNPSFAAVFTAEHPDSRGLFAVNAYDCVNAIALAANAAGSTDAARFVGELIAVTNDGTQCTTFGACDLLRSNDRDINYDGPSGDLDFDADRQPRAAQFDVFGYDSAGDDQTIGSVPGG